MKTKKQWPGLNNLRKNWNYHKRNLIMNKEK